MNIGAGSSRSGKSGRKRLRPEDDDDDRSEIEDEPEGDGVGRTPGEVRRKGKGRRIETLGQKKVNKEVYRKEKDGQKMAVGGQWSR